MDRTTITRAPGYPGCAALLLLVPLFVGVATWAVRPRALDPLVVTVAVVAAALAAHELRVRRPSLLFLLGVRLGAGRTRLVVATRTFELYRLADAIEAASRIAARVDALHVEAEVSSTSAYPNNSLEDVLRRWPWINLAPIRPATRVAVDVGYRVQRLVASDQFWIAPGAQGDGARVVRVRTQPYSNQVLVEVACATAPLAEAALAEIVRLADAHSVYRGKRLAVKFETGEVDDFGLIQKGTEVLSFLPDEPVAKDEVILPDRTWALIERAVFDAARKREALAALGVPAKRGLLFHGPPGTGKTLTCRYIASALAGTTTLVATGHALTHIGSICRLARMLQPSLVLLEDVDLAYAAREINQFSTALGELMDALDGLAPEEAVIFLLTTNSIERLEKAIADRPGRITQCVYFGPPAPELRHRYLARHLAGCDASRLDLERVVALTEGESQAYLKELVHRALQVCLDDPARAATATLVDQDFATAHAELKDDGRCAEVVGFGRR